MRKADVIIIGGGPAGYEAAALMAGKGLSTILIERDRLGGTCLNRGCIPTKCLCASARTADTVRKAPEFGVISATGGINFAAVRQRMDSVVDELRSGVETYLSKVEIIKGNAGMLSAHSVGVGDETYSAPIVIIATGSEPATLRCEGGSTALNSNQMLQLEEIPESLVIIGAGVIGLEFASVFSSLGSKVTLLEYAPEILAGSGVDPDVAKRLRMLLKKRGIDIVTSAEVTEITSDNAVKYATKKGSKEIEGDTVLAAVGRRPVLPQGIENAGIIVDRGRIKVDKRLRTNVEGVYAVGDVNGLLMLAHAATAQARAVAADMDYSPENTPGVVFTEPECAFVGKAQGEGTSTVTLPFGAVGKTLADGHPEGILKLVYCPESKLLLGAHAVGEHAADLIAEATLAITNGLSLYDIARTVHAHPSISELLAEASIAAL